MQTLDEIVASAPIFGGLHQDDLLSIAGCTRTAQFEAGEHLFREGRQAARSIDETLMGASILPR